MKPVLKMTNEEAREYYMSPKRYCTFDLPSYIDFSKVLIEADKYIKDGNGHRNGSKKVRELDDVNYRLLANKDGSYAWRPLQIIHPVLYVELINIITNKTNWETLVDKFSKFKSNENISCCSIPAKGSDSKNQNEISILSWWQNIEQASIRLSLEYKYLTTTDITDCYGALYTHTVAWAIHTKETAKQKRSDNDMFGNKIDKILQDMQNGQTNGIPQGSAVSDLIAEIVLGYADELLTKYLKDLKEATINKYKILRYRDDYRIFTQTAEDGKVILLYLTKALEELNLKLNTNKTHITDHLILGSIKPDKLYWNSTVKYDKSFFKTLLNISELAHKYPNSGSLAVAMSKFRKQIDKTKKQPKNNDVLIPMVVDIMYNNPRIYPTAASILSKLLSFEDDTTIKDYITKIIDKFKDIPNIGFLDIWLQRISIKYDRKLNYNEKLSKIAAGESKTLWNSEWLKDAVKQAIETVDIISEQKIKNTDKVISLEETELFLSSYF
jgi:hypothetical protein